MMVERALRHLKSYRAFLDWACGLATGFEDMYTPTNGLHSARAIPIAPVADNVYTAEH